MKNIINLLTLLLVSHINFSQDFFVYKISKPYCVFNFMQTAINDMATSPDFKKYIDSKTKSNTHFKQLCNDYSQINLRYNFKRYEFPDARRSTRSTYDLISIQAVNAKDLDDFFGSIIGILPMVEYQEFVRILKEAEKIYDVIVWNMSEKKMKKQLRHLEKFKHKNATIFNKFNHFYNSTWTNEIPFQIALYPIPLAKGISTATPHGNNLCVGVLIDETDYDSRNSVILHEMCHVLYDEQSKAVQNELVSFFSENDSPFTKLAFSYFDEALATALGNGWAYQELNGKMDNKEWYNEPYIEGFARSVYPMVADYLSQNKQIDNDFCDSAIVLFSEKFPNAISNYAILLRELNLYFDEEDPNKIPTELGKFFGFSSMNSSSPILHEFSLESMKSSNTTHLIVISQNHSNTLEKLKEIYPKINDINYEQDPINLSFFDDRNNAVILLIVNTTEELTELFKTMQTVIFFDQNKIRQD